MHSLSHITIHTLYQIIIVMFMWIYYVNKTALSTYIPNRLLFFNTHEAECHSACATNLCGMEIKKEDFAGLGLQDEIPVSKYRPLVLAAPETSYFAAYYKEHNINISLHV